MKTLETTKYCNGCEKNLQAIKFTKDRRAKSRLQTRCKECQSQQKKEYATTDRGREVHRRNKTKYRGTIEGHLACVFAGMTRRCTDLNLRNYENYGGKDIKCLFKNLDDFRIYVINELKIDPRGKQIHRINNDGHYEKGNITFLTPEEHRVIHVELRKLQKVGV